MLSVLSVNNVFSLKGVYSGQLVSLHATQHLFGPVHTDEERMGLDVVHASHTRPESFHWIVLKQLQRRTRRRPRQIFLRFQEATR